MKKQSLRATITSQIVVPATTKKSRKSAASAPSVVAPPVKIWPSKVGKPKVVKATRPRADVDWKAAGLKAWETRKKNGNVPASKPAKVKVPRAPRMPKAPTQAVSATI